MLKDKFKKAITDYSGSMLIITLAVAEESRQYIGIREKEAAAELGFDRKKIFVFDHNSPQKFMDMQFDVIYVIGGNTFLLMKELRDFGLDRLIKRCCENGAVYIGASAGAYIACPDFGGAGLFDANYYIKNGDYSGLSLTRKYVFCHSDMHSYPEYKEFVQIVGKDKDIISIGNTEVCKVDGDTVTFIE